MYQLLSTSSAQTLLFMNVAANMDFKENEYSGFVDNMRPIKMLPIQSTMRWWTETVQ